jgi:hypothetical protein
MCFSPYFPCLFIRPEPIGGSADNCIRVQFASAFQGAFPDGHDTPPGMQQGSFDFNITFTIAHDFGFPEFPAGSRPSEKGAVVSVPEASVNKNRGFSARKNEIRATREATVMKPISKSGCVQSTPDE